MVDYEALSKRTLGEVQEALTTSGVGVAGGLVLGGAIGRFVQNKVKSDADVTAAPTIGNYAMAWGGNNVPKLALWYLTRRYASSELTIDGRKALMGSVVFDTLMRLLNKGINPASAYIGTYQVLGSSEPGQGGAPAGDVQKLIQENSALRAELNKALERLGEAGLPDGPEARRRRYGAMPEESLQTPRQRRYAFMGENSGLSDLTARFGML
jgi:hypothetical protein